MKVDVPGILKQRAAAVDGYFETLLQRQTGAPARLIEAIAYSLRAGGKRLRPALVLETYQAVRGERNDGEKTALVAASALELIHTFSLVHDDLPAMDDDDLRRGVPTNHKVFGEAMAILAGDAMMALAFEAIGTDIDPDLIGPVIRELTRATGCLGMIGGQVLDMESENVSLSLTDLQRVHRLKTGALLTTSCCLGAIAARASEDTLMAVTDFGQHLGLAFQIIDDVLDETATPEQMGKATQKDAAAGKNTYPRLMGLEASKREAARQMDLAIAAIAPFGERAQRLVALARFVIDRTV